MLRTYEQVASSALRRLDAERPESFVCGFLFATLNLCDAYDAQIAPVLEREAIRQWQAAYPKALEKWGNSEGPRVSMGDASPLACHRSPYH